MRLEHSFTLPAPVAVVWRALHDLDLLARCLPGVVLAPAPHGEGGACRGVVTLRVGSFTTSYDGSACLMHRDDTAYRVVIGLRGRRTRRAGIRGTGGAGSDVTATLTVVLVPAEGAASTAVHTTLDLGGSRSRGRWATVVAGAAVAPSLERLADCLSPTLTSAHTSEPAELAEDDRMPASGARPPAHLDLGRGIGHVLRERRAPLVGAVALGAGAVAGAALARRSAARR